MSKAAVLLYHFIPTFMSRWRPIQTAGIKRAAILNEATPIQQWWYLCRVANIALVPESTLTPRVFANRCFFVPSSSTHGDRRILIL